MSSDPVIKFENSPTESLADSFISTPGTQYPSLFDTMDQSALMSPESFDDDSMFGDSMGGSVSGTPAPEKKPVKKRKSWGQQLPEPKTNVPPRKRAKTEDEKEQRRVERVLRNRRAAQSSRERKRLEVEALDAVKQQLERRVKDMEMQLANERQKRLVAERELEMVRAGNGTSMAVFRGSSPARSETFRQAPSPVTFSQELFSSRDAPRQSLNARYSAEPETNVQTVNPASLSPEIRPVEESNASFSDMTQHPAAMLCDLQCQSEEQRPWTPSMAMTMISQVLTYLMAMTLLTSKAYSTLLNSQNPMSQIIQSLTTGCSLSPTPSILRMIIWLTTTTTVLTTSTSMISSTTTKTTSLSPKFSLRIRLLNRLLACSPNLARPLMDATMAAMRLQSEQQRPRDCLTGVGSSDRLDGVESLSMESLMTLLWAIKVFGKRSTTEQVGRQDCRELNELFRPREVMGARGVPYISGGKTPKKSLEGWRSGGA